jgi:hypothetical protein
MVTVSWPRPNQIGDRVGWTTPKKPDCQNGGTCRPRQFHFLPTHKSIAVQVCRICGTPRYFEFKKVNGQMQPVRIEFDENGAINQPIIPDQGPA